MEHEEGYEDCKPEPHCILKFLCPPCAVWMHHDDCDDQVALACLMGCWYTMFCWHPKRMPMDH